MTDDGGVWRLTCLGLTQPLLCSTPEEVAKHLTTCKEAFDSHALEKLQSDGSPLPEPPANVWDGVPAPDFPIEERLAAVGEAMVTLNGELHLLAVDADLLAVLRTLILCVDELREVLRKMNEGVDKPRIVTPG